MAARIRFCGETAHPDYPYLGARKRLAARILIARNLRVRAEKLKIRSRILDDLIIEAEREPSSAAVFDNHDEPLSTFLQGIVIKVVARHASFHSTQPEPLASEIALVVKHFDEEARQIDCLACASSRADGAVCQHKAVDEEILANEARCMRFITTLFEFLVSLAERYYAPVLSIKPSDSLKIRLTASSTSDDRLSAKLKYTSDRPEERRAEVVLGLPVANFNDTHLLRLPYVLFHEIFVHAAEAWSAPIGRERLPREERTDEHCAFREGFVDAAALHVLRQALHVRSGLPEIHREFARDFSAEASAAHQERRSLGETGQVPKDEARNVEHAIRARRRGAALFDRFTELGLGDEAVRFALCLNHLTLTRDHRTRLMLALEMILEALDPPDEKRRFEPGIARWLDVHRQARELAQAGCGTELLGLIESRVDTDLF